MNFLKAMIFSSLVVGLSACDGAAGEHAAGIPNATATTAMASVGMQIGVKNVSNTELETLQQRGVTLIDIRLPEEWQQTGVVKDSQLLTFFNANGSVNPQFVSKATTMVAKGGEVAIICRTGNRSLAAADMLVKAGIYPRVYNVTQGITGWIGAGKPVTAAH